MDWYKKRVLIIGAARQGIALARYLSSLRASVVITDVRQPDELLHEQDSLSDCDIEWVLGGHPLKLLEMCDLVCPSGGVPLTIPIVVEAKTREIPLSNDSQIFLETAPCKVIGITGSAGKTTTTTLVGRMVKAAIGPEQTWVGGNIGLPLLSDIEKMNSDHLAVMELSSFQLEIMTSAPQVAGVLNLTPNHLDRHITMDAYRDAKAQILRNQRSDDIAILGSDSLGSWALKDDVRGTFYSFGFERKSKKYPGVYLRDNVIALWDGKSWRDLFPKNKINLRGDHNIKNVLAACVLAYAADVPPDAMFAGVDGFSGVEHRLEFVREWGGAEWFNDSSATAPERSMAAIRAFNQPLVLLAGGRDKALPWDDFGTLVRQRVDHLIIFGEAKDTIKRAVVFGNSGDRPHSVDICDDLEEAVKMATQIVVTGDVVLLSPGGTSFDEFSDFAERGECFRKWVNALP